MPQFGDPSGLVDLHLYNKFIGAIPYQLRSLPKIVHFELRAQRRPPTTVHGSDHSLPPLLPPAMQIWRLPYHRQRRLGEDTVAAAAGASPLPLRPPPLATPIPHSGGGRFPIAAGQSLNHLFGGLPPAFAGIREKEGRRREKEGRKQKK